uniref:Guanine nucleotide-binding protein subunit beta-like protein n=1 Tax=Trypanosoma congolense (strain IL3000) TaxID=1068625 RepID=G0UNU0_TRYCI|nr:conserved hypothetical protein [Trypanosoma congolense IL3000]
MSCTSTNVASVLRTLPLHGESVVCMAVSSQLLVWCGQDGTDGSHVMYGWSYQGDEPFQRPLLDLSFAPLAVSIYQEKIVVVGECMVALFLCNLDACMATDDGTLDEKETFLLTTEFITRGIPAGTTHLSWSTDGATVAISSPHAMTLLDTRLRSNEDEASPPILLALDCGDWFDDPGASFTTFGGSALFVLSKTNHLISLKCDDSWWEVEPFLQRDGHILSRTQQVTSFTVGGSEEGHLVVGYSDGTLRLIMQDTLEVFFTVDVTRQLYREVSSSCLDLTGESLYVTNVVVGPKFMVVIRRDAVVFYDRRSLELLTPLTVLLGEKTPCISAVSGDGTWGVWVLDTQELLYFPMSSTRTPFDCDGEADEATDIVHARLPLPSRLLEPLLLPSQRKPEEKEPSRSRGKADPGKGRKVPADKPVTFGHPIKSSGYVSSAPWSVQQRDKKLLKRTAKASKPINTDAALPRYTFLSPVNHPFAPMASANKVLLASPIHRAVVTSAKFSANGSALLTASGDATAFMLKFPVAKNGGDGIALRVHESSVNTIDVSTSIKSPVVVTGSGDEQVAVWQPMKRSSPYIVEKIGKNIRATKFIYTDMFIGYAASNTVTLCRYILDDGGGDLDRKRNESRMKMMLEFTAPSAQYVVGFDAINYFASNIVMWAASNKSFGIYDIAVGQHISIVEDAHTRPLHSIASLAAGRYASVGSAQLHMCLTAGMDNCVRLWDIRQKRSVRQLAQHRNSATTVGAAFSPNGSLVAVGSETRAVLLYDVGTGAVLDKIVTNDVPTSICWHPIENILAVGAANGGIHFMGQK